MAGRFRGLALTFEDILLEPAYSTVNPLDVQTSTKVTKKLRLSIPILSAASDTVTEAKMAAAMAGLGGLGVIHRNLSIARQAYQVSKAKMLVSNPTVKEKTSPLVGAAIGVGEDLFDRSKKLIDAGVDILVVDTAHGHHKNVLAGVRFLKKTFPKTQVIAGNVATAAATKDLIESGADAVKVGIGSGSICITRDITGVGVPQFTAIAECAKAAQGRVPLVADGGIRSAADFAKALAAGASSVMLGSMLAGTNETPGLVVKRAGKKFKLYRGMGSLEAIRRRGTDRYFQKEVVEGISAKVEYKGSVRQIITYLTASLRSAMGYYGASEIKDLWKVKYWQITSAGVKESHPHSVIVDSKKDFAV